MNKPKLLFIGKGGKKEGMGHLVRIGVLADALSPHYDVSILVMQDSYGDSFFKRKGMTCFTYRDNRGLYRFLETRRERTLPPSQRPYTVIIIDIYRISIGVIRKIRGYCDLLINFDDMRRRIHHSCDGVFICPQEPFQKDVSNRGNTIVAKGTDFFPLAGIFREYRERKHFHKNVNHIGIVLGGVPSSSPTLDLVRLMDQFLDENIYLHAVMGFEPGQFDKSAFSRRVIFRKNVDNMAEFIFNMDAGIIAGGFIKFEFMCIGTPFLLIARVEHQEILARKFSRQGCGVYLGTIRDHQNEIPLKSRNTFKRKIERFLIDANKREEMFMKSRRLVDGNGCSRIVEMVKKLSAND